jgi:hypothetical protein
MSAFASCLGTERLVGGGYSLFYGDPIAGEDLGKFHVIQSQPVGVFGGQWIVQGYVLQNFTGPEVFQIFAYALCAS